MSWIKHSRKSRGKSPAAVKIRIYKQPKCMAPRVLITIGSAVATACGWNAGVEVNLLIGADKHAGSIRIERAAGGAHKLRALSKRGNSLGFTTHAPDHWPLDQPPIVLKHVVMPDGNLDLALPAWPAVRKAA